MARPIFFYVFVIKRLQYGNLDDIRKSAAGLMKSVLLRYKNLCLSSSCFYFSQILIY